MACYPLQRLPMTIQFTQGDNMYNMRYTTAFTNSKMPTIGQHPYIRSLHISVFVTVAKPTKALGWWDGKPDQTPLTRHDMNFWFFSGEPTTTT